MVPVCNKTIKFPRFWLDIKILRIYRILWILSSIDYIDSNWYSTHVHSCILITIYFLLQIHIQDYYKQSRIMGADPVSYLR